MNINELINEYNVMKGWTSNEAAHGNIEIVYIESYDGMKNDIVVINEKYLGTYKVFTQDQAHLLRPYLEKHHAAMIMRNEYDFYNAGETWYTETETELYANGETTARTFPYYSDIYINSIDYSLRGYGVAYIEIDDHSTELSLDELYVLTFHD